MWNNIIMELLNMSLTGSIVIVFVLLLRLLLKRAPKVYSYALWSVVLFRLVCPVSFESPVSLLPSNPHPISGNILYDRFPQIDTGITAIDDTVASILPQATPYASVNPMQINLLLFRILWIAGIAGMLLYGVISLIRLRSHLKNAVQEEGNVFLSDTIPTAFVTGLIRPRIYLPSSLTGFEKKYILLHENTHIRRCDHLVKIAAFLVLCVHWFNPLVWIAYFLCMNDMEMSCDESVIKHLGSDIKKEYSTSLLALASGKRYAALSPLAFGEGSPKTRIKNVLRYQKPAVWIGTAVLLIVILFLAGFAANPKARARQNGEHLKNSVITSAFITLKDGTRAELMIVMTDGIRISGEEYGYGADIGEMNDIGSAELRLYLDKKMISRYPLTEEAVFPDGLIFHDNYFEIASADYNEDGNPDFSLGQWGSSSVRLYSLFTVLEDGTIKAISDPLAIADSSTMGSSVLFEHSDRTITAYPYNNAEGASVTQSYIWEEMEQKFVPVN